MAKLLQPQEIEVFFVLPALRREIAKSMKEQGFGQKEIAVRLGLSEAAVSHYIREKRAQDVQFNANTLTKIKEAAKKVNGPHSLVAQTQLLLSYLKAEKMTCVVCKEQNTTVPASCNACFEAI